MVDSQKQEHKLGNSFKYEILSCLPPIMAGKMMLQVVKLDVPQNIQWHLVDAITLQFATSAIEFGRSDLSTVASNWQSSGINAAQGVLGTVAAAAAAASENFKIQNSAAEVKDGDGAPHWSEGAAAALGSAGVVHRSSLPSPGTGYESHQQQQQMQLQAQFQHQQQLQFQQQHYQHQHHQLQQHQQLQQLVQQQAALYQQQQAHAAHAQQDGGAQAAMYLQQQEALSLNGGGLESLPHGGVSLSGGLTLQHGGASLSGGPVDAGQRPVSIPGGDLMMLPRLLSTGLSGDGGSGGGLPLLPRSLSSESDGAGGARSLTPRGGWVPAGSMGVQPMGAGTMAERLVAGWGFVDPSAAGEMQQPEAF